MRHQALTEEHLTQDHLDAYEIVRRSCLINMYDVRNGTSLSGLTPEQYLGVMKNYDSLMSKYGQRDF